ncbi:hypothetical protein SPSIL_033030 [Sporomusa silvacetica DSM 10669]|uniref:N-acetyltransferase domain-containing protein n=1 Tax=Sporomusa silvacetica DSM 10669 TaxID=1123289 RepID=A0ABZ3INX8_9FIRM|nr:GNAT family N-acetyltransferase [Sporomusa silvacetica]OZC18060.1 putative acetyltransferase [Sporomusa silvacetica DSM 10669]
MNEWAVVKFRDILSEKDISSIIKLVQQTAVFNEEELAVAEELLRESLEKGEQSYYKCLLAEQNGSIAGYACYATILGTNGSFELYWLVVEKESQRTGLGAQIMKEFENKVRQAGGKRIFVGTSSQEDYLPARAMYESWGYNKTAVLEDFYDNGVDLIYYAKSLPTS